MANIRERNGRFQISVYVGEDRQTGKKLFERTTFTPSETAPSKIKKEVDAFALAFEERVKNGKFLEAEKLTFRDVMNLWKEDQSFKDLTIAASEGYLRILERIALPAFGNILIGKINPINLQSIYNEMEKDGKAPKTIKRTNTAINAVFRFAYRMEIIQNNPCDRVRLPKTQKSEALHYFDERQAKIFLNALASEYTIKVHGHNRTLRKTGEKYTVPDYATSYTLPLQLQIFFTLALYSGCRRGELIALQWRDVDIDNQIISITKAISKTKGKGQIVKTTKTKAGIRELMLPKNCFDMLRKWKTEQKNLSLSLGTKWTGERGKSFDDNFIFIRTDNLYGSRMDVDTPTHAFQSFLDLYNESEEEKLPKIRLHDLRHTSATLLLAKGIDIETVSHRLGHSQASITLDVYGHSLRSMDETASNMLENLLNTGSDKV